MTDRKVDVACFKKWHAFEKHDVEEVAADSSELKA